MWKVLGWRCNLASARRHPAARPALPTPRVAQVPWPAGVDASGRAASTRVAQKYRRSGAGKVATAGRDPR